MATAETWVVSMERKAVLQSIEMLLSNIVSKV